jgi:hypothetical protein
MGIGFVLFFWALILGVMAMPFSIALGLWSWWNERRTHGRGWVFKAVVAAALPFILLAYAGAAFGVYAIWCEAVRNVDAGIGDSWRVPVTNDYYFCVIDVPDHGYLLKGGCTGSPIVDGITELAAGGDVVLGKSESTGPFLLDTRTAALQNVASLDDAMAGMTPRPILRTADDFYNDRRWGRADAVAGALIAIPAVTVAIFWYVWFIRSRPAPRHADLETS